MNGKSLIQLFKTRRKQAGKRRWGCLDESQIAAYADHQISGREKGRAEAHLGDCDYCLEQVGFAVRMQRAEMPESAPDSLLLRARKLASSKARAEGRTLWAWGKIAAASAAACAVLVTVLSLRQSPTAPTGVQRQVPMPRTVQRPTPAAPVVPAEQHSVVRGGQKPAFAPAVVTTAAGNGSAANRIGFRWQPVSGAADYQVIVQTPDGDQAWEQRTTATSIELPGSVSLEAGQKYFVTIRAYLAEGKSIQSAPASFTLGRR